MIHQFLPVAEQEEADARRSRRAAARLLERAAPGLHHRRRGRAPAGGRPPTTPRCCSAGPAASDLPEGMASDTDLRWLVLRNLAASGTIGEPEIDAALELDRTLQGSLQALRAKASRPDARLQGVGLGPADGGPGPLQLRDERARGRVLDRPGPRRRPAVRRALLHRRAGDGRAGRRGRARPRRHAGLPEPGGRAGDARPDAGGAGARRPEPGGAPRARGRRLRAGRGGALAGACSAGGEASHDRAPDGNP